jgi:hypothetical protein
MSWLREFLPSWVRHWTDDISVGAVAFAIGVPLAVVLIGRLLLGRK